MKGFKVFNADWTCRGFQYEVGKEYTHEGEVVACESGFHFCSKLVNCFSYYDFDPNNKVAEVEAIGKVIEHDDKVVTNHIRIIREVSWHEALELVNTGKGNTGKGNTGRNNSGDRNSGDGNSGDGNSGYRNSGDGNSGDGNSGYRNSGYGNSGYRNSGDGNSGDGNSGDGNSGYRNSGYGNSGYRNSGDGNSGDGNSGYGNSGDFNSCNYSSGAFCNEEPKFLLFNKPSPISREEFQESDAYWICRRLEVVEKVDEQYKPVDYKMAWQKLWSNLSNVEKNTVQSIPNFDADVFETITGIRV